MPPSQMRPEPRQRLYYVRVLPLFETCTNMKHLLVESVSSRIVISTHPGLISGLSLRRSTPTANVRWSSEHSSTYTKRFAGCRTATGLREFGVHESDGSPDEKERRPKHQPPGYQA